MLETGGGSIAYRFEGRDLNLVLTPPPGGAAPFTVRLDGQPPGRGPRDRRRRGRRRRPRRAVDAPARRRRGAIRERTVEISFEEPGVGVYVFTFG